LFWPDGKTEVRPGERPLSSEECYEQLCGHWRPLDVAAAGGKARMHYVELKATQGSTPERPSDSVHTNDFVAVKEIIVRHLDDKVKLDEALRLAQEEFKHLSKIRHCHIIASLDMIQHPRKAPQTGDDQHHFIILLYPLAVRNLAQHLEWYKNYPDDRTPEQLINFLPCLCQAVLYLHNFSDSEESCSPMRHRDIKPENILVDVHDGNHGILLADFDISKQYDDVESAATSGATRVTKQYAAGVLLIDGQQHERSFETDIISLGFVFLEVLTVVLGASRAEMLRSFPTADGPDEQNDPDRFCHSKALELKYTWAWIKRLLHRIYTQDIPERLRNGAAERMIQQIIQMMNADFGAKGVLEEAHGCFSTIADRCEHCFCSLEPSGLFEHEGCLSNGQSYLDLSTSSKQKRYLRLPHIPHTSLPDTATTLLRRIRSEPLLRRSTTSERSSLSDQESCPDPEIGADHLTSNGGFALHPVGNIAPRS
jgi:serine/threonine protein kinase